MPRSADEAIAWGRLQVTNGSSHWFNICLIFVRSCFDVDALYPDAGTAWNLAKLKHRTSDPTEIPAGVPVFWETPGEFDHIALSTGGGRCLSNDIRANGRISEVPIDEITRDWNSPLLGWTEDLNGVTVYSPEEPDVQLSDDLFPNDKVKNVSVGDVLRKLNAFIAREDKRAARLKEQVAAVKTAVDGLPEGATKAEVRKMLENLDATIQILVNDDQVT